MFSKLTIKTPERRYWRRSGVFIVNFEHISHLVLVFLSNAGLVTHFSVKWKKLPAGNSHTKKCE